MTEAFVPLPRQARQRPRRPRASLWALLFATIVGGAVYASVWEPQQQAMHDDPAVRAVVESQLQAFAAADASKAFALADPSLRTRFGSAEAFLASVQADYPMVLNPTGVLFLKPESDGHIALQKVRITDGDGNNWMVTYLLNRQADHQWKISGALIQQDGMQVMA